MRKHFTQMTYKEKLLLKCLIAVKHFTFTEYSLFRVKSRGLKKWQVIRAIREGNIIEYHYVNSFQQRVLIRGITPIRGLEPCVVVNILNGQIITAYLNDIEDTHKTLHKELYNSHINICYLITVNACLNDVFYLDEGGNQCEKKENCISKTGSLHCKGQKKDTKN